MGAGTLTQTRRTFLRRWAAWVTFGEFLGFCLPAVTAALLWDRATWLMVPGVMAAGAGEGAVLGWSQTRVLRREVAGISVRRWVGLTALGAAFAWLVGMTPSTTFETWSGWPPVALVAAGAALAGLLLVSIGSAQWFELRRHVDHAPRWVAATAFAWALGLSVFGVVTTPLWQPGQSTILVVAIGVLGGLVMAFTMSLTTGWAMQRLLASTTPSTPRARAPVSEPEHVTRTL
jgi:hypothetical protein